MKVQIDRQIAAMLRPQTAEENATLRCKLMLDGCLHRLPYAVINGVPIQLDGHHTRAICVKERIAFDWVRIERVSTKAEAIAWVKQNQIGRRNSDDAELDRLREQRRERVVEARQEGQSTRAIAEAEGVSQTTVQNDLKASTEQGCSVDPPNGKVTGKDGKERPATAEPTRPPPTHRRRSGRSQQGRPEFNLGTAYKHLGQFLDEVNKLAKAAGHVKPNGKPHMAESVQQDAEHKEIDEAINQVKIKLQNWAKKLRKFP